MKDFAEEFVLRRRWWVAGREVSVLESFSGLKMCADINDCLLVKSFTFEKSGIQEVYFFV